MKFTWSSHEVQIIRSSYEFHMYFMWTVYELMSTSLVLHGYNTLTSLILRCELHMSFIRTASKFIWINLISFYMKIMRSSFELHTKFIWTFRESWISYELIRFHFIWNSWEVHMNFIWSSYEVNNKFLYSSNSFMLSYGYMVSYGLHMNEPPGPS